MLKLLSVNNLSGAAYTLLAPQSGFAHQYATPAEICQQVQNNECDAALLPVACLESVSLHYEPLGTYGIACKGPVGSVLLFCDLPLQNIASDHLPVFISEDSRTSRMLFQQLYQKKFGTAPVVTQDIDKAFARVYIGNKSLDIVSEQQSHAEVIDLCAWWYQETGLPCVFARWMVNSSLSAQDKKMIEDWLDHTTRFAISPKGKQEMAMANEELFPVKLTAQEYYDRLHYRLGKDELTGLDFFLSASREMTTCHQIA